MEKVYCSECKWYGGNVPLDDDEMDMDIIKKVKGKKFGCKHRANLHKSVIDTWEKRTVQMGIPGDCSELNKNNDCKRYKYLGTEL